MKRHQTEGSGILYHGTSLARWEAIVASGHLRVALSGPPKISLTTSYAVAEHWARISAEVDAMEGRLPKSGAPAQYVILEFQSTDLQDQGYQLNEYSDPVWGEGACDWENEVACWSPIDLASVMPRVILPSLTLEALAP